MQGYDPIELARTTENVVCKGLERKYYRFRYTRFYGGSAAADVVGCNLRCAYCWSWKYITQPQQYGSFYPPQEVAKRLNSMGRITRITGGEPTICFEHLLEVIKRIKGIFILETNGILLDDEKVEKLSHFKNLFVRVSLKGVDEKTFNSVTGADGKFFHHQINALKLLYEYGVRARPAILFNLFTRDQLAELQKRLLDIWDGYVLEFEPFVNYGGALKRLEERRLQLLWQ